MPPKVFVSYSHDDDEHKAWVLNLAERLVQKGIEIVLDQWDMQLGSNLPTFMEQGMTVADRVLVICTDNYNRKSNEGRGGVGYEKNILTGELLQDQSTSKFIPCIRGVSTDSKTPTCLSGRLYIDFSYDETFEDQLEELLRELHNVPANPRPPIGKNPFDASDEKQRPSIGGKDSTVFFSERFSSAFPGVRGIQWFNEPTEAIDRLKILLADPIAFEGVNPIWWWRDGENHIESFSVLAPDTVLLDIHELKIAQLAAVNSGSYYQSFVYIRSEASEPSGIYDSANIDKQLEHWDYASEEYALFRGRPISLAEYEDNAAVIDGRVFELDDEAEPRMRYITPYNLLLAANGNPINNKHFDPDRRRLLGEILRGESSLDDLAQAILQLPKRGYGR